MSAVEAGLDAIRHLDFEAVEPCEAQGNPECSEKASWLAVPMCCEDARRAMVCEAHRARWAAAEKAMQCQWCKRVGRIRDLVRFVPLGGE